MQIAKVRKNFILDKDTVEKVQNIIQEQQKNLTEVIGLYFRAIVKEPSILDTVEKSANQRTGSFIGMLDTKVGNDSYKELTKESYSKSDI